MPKPLVLEGTWEEIVTHAKQLAGRKVRLTVLSPKRPKRPRKKKRQPARRSFFSRPETLEEICARQGIKPIKDLRAFLDSLPNLGKAATRLWEAIAENRAMRRAIAEEDGR